MVMSSRKVKLKLISLNNKVKEILKLYYWKQFHSAQLTL